jgi:hypothetical protein
MDVAGATVPLKRAVVEEMLVQRLADRLHTLSDGQLAELLEQVLQDDVSRFPSELLKPAPPALATPQAARRNQPLQSAPVPTVPPQPEEASAPLEAREPQPGSPTAASSASKGQAARDGGAIGGGVDSSGSEQAPAADGEVDLTQDLLQQVQRQLQERSGGNIAASDRISASSRISNVLGSNWRLALLAVVGPAVLIASLTRLTAGKDKQVQQQLPAEQPLTGAEDPQQLQQQQAKPAAQQGQRTSAAGQQAKRPSLLSWLFPRDEEPEEQDGAAPPAAPASHAAPEGLMPLGAPMAPQSPATVPPPPPLPPGINLQQVNGGIALSDTGVAPGAILWQRKERAPDLPDSGGQDTAGSSSAVLWQRAEADSPPVREAGLQPQQETGQEPASAMLAPVATQASDASGTTVDLWRVPLDQLRSSSSSAVVGPSQAAPLADGSSGGGLAGELPASAPPGQASSEAANGWSEEQPSLARNGSAPSPAPSAPVLSRRQSSAAPGTALDNAEPAGWPGRVQSLRGRMTGGLRAGGQQDGE